MGELIDISVRLLPGMPIWPASRGIQLERTRTLAAGDGVNVSRLDMDVHCGTHVEGPLHYIDGGTPMEAIPIDTFVGRAHVLHLPDVLAIGRLELDGAAPPGQLDRLLIRTRNSLLWVNETHDFQTRYVALTPEGATWVVERGIRLIGVDYLSVQRFEDDSETHRILMRAGVAILEGINLDGVSPGDYRLTCLPLRLAGTEAAPARAILETL
jgi:arylformamidase